MINMDNIPNKMVSGVSDEELNWISKESCDRFLIELGEDFLSEYGSPESNMEKFQDLNDQIIKQLDNAEKSSIPKSSAFSTQQWTSKFKQFLKSKNLSDDIENMPVRFLSQYLRYFYHNLIARDGRPYSQRLV